MEAKALVDPSKVPTPALAPAAEQLRRRSPLDAEIVTTAAEDRLILRARAGCDEAGNGLVLADDFLEVFVHGDFGGDVEVDADVAGLAIQGLHRPGDVGHGAGEDVEVLREERGEEGEDDFDLVVGEGVVRHGREDFHFLLGKSFDVRRLVAHEAEGLVIDPDEAGHPLLVAGPVAGRSFVQGVVGRPDREVGRVGDEGHRRWAERVVSAACEARGQTAAAAIRARILLFIGERQLWNWTLYPSSRPCRFQKHGDFRIIPSGTLCRPRRDLRRICHGTLSRFAL